MFEFILQHQSLAALALYWIFSGAVSALPDPGSGGSPSSAGYLWLYRFSHTIAGNLTTVFGSRIPGLKSIGLILIFPLLWTASACAAHYTIHPGAQNAADSAAYDALLIAQTTIDQARLDFQAGHLPEGAKPALDALIRSYNVARDSWLTYRRAVPSNVLSDLAAAIQAFQAFEEAK